MKRRIFPLLALIIQAFLCSWLVMFLWGASSFGLLFGVLALASLLFYPTLAWAVKRLDSRLWIFAAFLVLAGLLLPSAELVEYGQNLGASLPGWMASPLQIGLILLPAVALALAALLLAMGLNLLAIGVGEPDSDLQEAYRQRLAAGVLVLSAALVAKSLHNLFWLTAWDNTFDPIEYFWLIPGLIGALASGGMLLAVLPGKKKLAGLYSLAVPGLMIAVSTRAQQIDFRQLNDARAERISQAVETFYAREGRYPKRLQELIPRHLLSIPTPFIIYGQDWCYDGGNDYYRLGYADREHWSSPIFTGQVYQAKGPTDHLPPVCEQEVAGLRQRFSEIYSQKGP